MVSPAAGDTFVTPPFVIPPNSEKEIVIRFAPTDADPSDPIHSSIVRISAQNVPDDQAALHFVCEGSAVWKTLAIDASDLDLNGAGNSRLLPFGNVCEGETQTGELVIENTGGIEIDKIEIDPDGSAG